MAKLAFIGDPLIGAGFRLGGATLYQPETGQEAAALQTALANADLVVISQKTAKSLPAELLERAQRGPWPLFLVLAERPDDTTEDPLLATIKKQLGMAT
jgi:vacuolar-type H+-ATPase subunit F/Vma7